MSRRKKDRNRKKYSKSQFSQIICPTCKICGKNADPKFCYMMYSQSPENFLATVLSDLIKFRRAADNKGIEYGSMDVTEFERIFCNSGICEEAQETYGETPTCSFIAGCFMEFRAQANNGKKDKKKCKSKSDKYVAQSYPTFFCSDMDWARKVLGVKDDCFGCDQCVMGDAVV